MSSSLHSLHIESMLRLKRISSVTPTMNSDHRGRDWRQMLSPKGNEKGSLTVTGAVANGDRKKGSLTVTGACGTYKVHSDGSGNGEVRLIRHISCPCGRHDTQEMNG